MPTFTYKAIATDDTLAALVGSANPAYTVRRDNYQPVHEICVGATVQQGQQQCGHILDGGRMRFDTNHAVVCGQRQHSPIAEVLIQSDEYATVTHGAFENQRVIGPLLADFRRSDDIVTMGAQLSCEFRPQHLVKIKTHNRSRGFEGGNFGMQNGLASVIQYCLNIGTGQFRVPAQDRIPRFAGGELFQNGCHRNTGAFDDRLATTDAGMDLNALVHATENTGIKRPTQA